MKRLILICAIVLLVSNISAIRINEIEMNPEDGGEGKEWIEIYNDEEEIMDLSGWEVWDGLKTPTKRQIISNETIIEKGDFYVIELKSAVLNNGGDFVILYNSEGNEIDRTETLKDSSWSFETWQWCGSWEFLEATKRENNKCETEEEEKEAEANKTENETEISEESIFEITEDEETGTAKQSTTAEVIKLTPKNIKSNKDNQILDNSDYAKYGFAVFCVLLGLLFLLRRKNRLKNEFNQERQGNKGN